MLRRHMLSLLAAGTAAAALPGLASARTGLGADGVLRGRVAANAAPRSPWENQWTIFRKGLAESGAPIALDYFLRSEIGNEEAMLAALRRNRVQIGGFTLQGLASVVPELSVLMLPYLFDSADELDFIYEHHLTAPVQALFQARGMRLLQWTEVGWTSLYANRPVRLPTDMAGVKLRGSPNPAAQGFLRMVGADAIALGIADLVPALQTGLVDGGLSGVVFHWFVTRAYASHFTLTEHSYDTGALVANEAWFGGATAEQRTALVGAFGPASVTRDAVRGLAANLLARMEAEGITVHRLTGDERATWRTTTRPLHDRLVAEIGGSAAALYQAVQDGKQAFQAARGL